MSLDKAIKSGKEHRKEWYDARASDPWCRNHGKDTWYTRRVLQYPLLKARAISRAKLRDWQRNLDD